MNLLAIVNPNAGKNKGIKALKKAIPLLNNNNITVDVKTSEYSGHSTKLAGEYNNKKHDGIIAVGGDGTLFEVINGLLKSHENFDAPIAQIPVGTGNSFIKDLNIENVEDAVQKIVTGKTKKIDVGHFKYPEGDHYFINLIGVGFVSNVAFRAGKYKAFGSLSYIIGVIEEVIQLQSSEIELTIDGVLYKNNSVFIEICNSTKTGGDMIMAPNAKLDDGLLDIIVLNECSKFHLLKTFPKIFKGDHIHDAKVEYLTGKNIILKTDKKLRLTPDGEVFGHTPIEVNIIPKRLTFYC